VKIISTLIAITALPLIALGQAPDQQQGAAPGQPNESHEKAPAKKKKAPAANEPGKAQAETEILLVYFFSPFCFFYSVIDSYGFFFV